MTGPVLAIDPGPELSSWVVWCPNSERVIAGQDQALNDVLGMRLRAEGLVLADQLVIERPVVLGGHGASAALLETAFWAGVFLGSWPGLGAWPREVGLLTYHRVRSHLTQCGSAKEAQVKQALISRFAPSGYGKEGKGTKAAPGPFYGVAGHMWSAVAVAVAWCDLSRKAAQLESDSAAVVG